MRISDWSSDVCSSDLLDVVVRQPEKICARPTALPELEPRPPRLRIAGKQDAPFDHRDSKIGIIHAIQKTVDHGVRSKARSVRNGCVSTCTSRWPPFQ